MKWVHNRWKDAYDGHSVPDGSEFDEQPDPISTEQLRVAHSRHLDAFFFFFFVPFQQLGLHGELVVDLLGAVLILRRRRLLQKTANMENCVIVNFADTEIVKVVRCQFINSIRLEPLRNLDRDT